MKAYYGKADGKFWAASGCPEAHAWGETKEQAQHNLMQQWSRMLKDTYSPEHLTVVVEWLDVEEEVVN